MLKKREGSCETFPHERILPPFFLGGIIRSAFHLQVLITLKSVKFLPTQSCGNRDAEKLSN